jgi:hypothetical protein
MPMKSGRKQKLSPSKGGIPMDQQPSPLYQGGEMNGPLGGPTDPPQIPDPFLYLEDRGMSKSGGSPADNVSISANEHPKSHFGKE